MRPRNTILLAIAIVYVIANWIPFGHTALYPLTLFTTWVHEMGHGLTALLMGGGFDSLEIYRNAGGVAHCGAAPGWPEALVCAGGLLAPPLLGSTILAVVHGPRRARILLAVLAGALVLSVIVYVRSAAGLVAMPAVAALLGWAAWRGFAEHPERRVVLAQMLGVLLVPGCEGSAEESVAKFLVGEKQGDPTILEIGREEDPDDPMACMHDCAKCSGCGPSELLKQIRDYYKIGLTYSSNAIEGNSLTETETKVLLEDGLTVGGTD